MPFYRHCASCVTRIHLGSLNVYHFIYVVAAPFHTTSEKESYLVTNHVWCLRKDKLSWSQNNGSSKCQC